MAVYNIDFRKIFVLAFLVVTMYWLMLPSKDTNSSPTVPVVLEHSKNPSDDKMVTEDTEKGKPPFVKEKLEDELLQLKQKHSEANQLHEKSMQSKELIIQSLKNKIEKHNSQLLEKEEKLSGLEKKVRQISSLVDEKEKQYNKLLNQVKSKPTLPKESTEKLSVSKENSEIPFSGLKLVHLDLKGAPPKMDYLIEFMKIAKTFGANGFLMEYEDMFPWSGEFKVLAHENAYSKSDINRILEFAKEEGMEVIPLVQTFGHFEFVLKHKEFVRFQAVKKVTTSICPLNNDSVPFVKRMIDQIIDLHPSSKWIHLGGDEVWNIKSCDRCISGNYSDADLYLRHMMPIIKYVKSKSIGQTKTTWMPIIWDDMMRHWTVDDLKKMAEDVVPMVWGYVSNLDTYLNFPDGMWDRYMEVFPNIWFASSFKGALKPWSNVVPIKQHIDNHLSWLKIYNRYHEKGKKVVGIALTGWSRFDHYGPLCELLPAGIPSLAICLGILKQGTFDSDLHRNISVALGFKKDFQTRITSFKKYSPEKATFKGHEIFTLAGALENAVGWKDWAEVRLTGWSRPYFIEKKHLSFYQMNTSFSGLEKSSVLLEKVKADVEGSLSKVFDEYVVDEWMKDRIAYFEEMTKSSLARVKEVMKQFED